MPTKTPVWLPDKDSGLIPAFSIAVQVSSSRIRCCGSIKAASRGEIRKNGASNWSTCSKNPPYLLDIFPGCFGSSVIMIDIPAV